MATLLEIGKMDLRSVITEQSRVEGVQREVYGLHRKIVRTECVIGWVGRGGGPIHESYSIREARMNIFADAVFPARKQLKHRGIYNHVYLDRCT